MNTYNLFNQLVETNINVSYSAYSYNANGIRTAKSVNGVCTVFLLDGGNVVGEVQNDTVKATYLRGANLILRETDTAEQYYIFNAHGDVTALTNDAQAVTKSYDYDAFGNEKEPSATDANPFRYCGEYFDKETGTYYLRARYYDPSIGRFTQQDTHWNTANMIYGDNPNKINEREDSLGLKAYTYTPSISSIMQSGNLYVYCVNNPIRFGDQNGRWIHIAIGAFVGAAIGGIYSAVEQSLIYGKVNAEEVFIRATFGAIDGLLVSSGVTFTGGAFVQGVLFSGLEEGMIQTSRIKTGRESHYNSTGIITSMVIGGTLGYLGGGSQSRKHLENLSDKFLKRLDSLDEAYKAAKYYIKSSIKETTDIVKDIVEGKIKSVAADISLNEFECFVLYD